MSTIAPETIGKTRTWPLWTSVVTLALTAAIHIVVGSPEYLSGIGNTALPPETSGLAVALWHLTSVLLVLLPVGLIWASRQNRDAGRPIIAAVWLISLAFVVIMLGVDLASGGIVSPLVQWTLFVPSSALLPFVVLPSTPVSPQPEQ